MLKNKLLSAMGGAPANYIEDVFSTYLYTGTGATQTITNGIDLAGEGGLVWMKRRDSGTALHTLIDTVRGVNKQLFSSSTASQYSYSDTLTAFNSTGFTLGSDTSTEFVNANTASMVSWTFRKQPKFFDIVTWTGDGTGERVINHSLAVAPRVIIYKQTSGSGGPWSYTQWDGTQNLWLRLNESGASSFSNATGGYISAEPSVGAATPTSITLSGNSGVTQVNTTGATYVAYLFAHNAGGFGLTGTDNVISCGSVVGASQIEVNLGYEPQWILVKNASAAQDWWVVDNMRGLPVQATDTSYNASALRPNLSDAETTGFSIAPSATGFKANVLTTGSTYIYIAIRRGPMKVPTDGTSVFAPVAYTGTGAAGQTLTGASFPPDLSIFQSRAGAGGAVGQFVDRLRGGTAYLPPSSTAAEGNTAGYYIRSFNMDGVTYGTSYIDYNANGTNYINWLMQRAPGFFDEVCWTGNNSTNQRVSHNLGVAPELIIYKGRNKVNYWRVYFGDINKYIQLDAAIAAVSGSNFWGSSAPTTTDFGINCGSMDLDSFNAVGYLFATCPGVSKVGTYTGTATTLQINCGFTAGARFVLIKRTDSTGDWYVWDSARGIVAGNDPYLLLNSTAAEVTSTDYVDTYSAGFELTSTAPAAINASGGTYIFLAIA